MDRSEDSSFKILKLLADEHRWRIVRELRFGDYQVGELTERLHMPQNLISYHLQALRDADLVRLRSSDADARSKYYSLDIDLLQAAYQQIGLSFHLDTSTPSPIVRTSVAFLCSANSARSQMAEAWLRYLSAGAMVVRSAGIRPSVIHPLTIQVMEEAGIDLAYQYAKHLTDINDVTPNVVVTVCDLAREELPDWTQTATYLHWSIADPVNAQDPLHMFRTVRDELRRRVSSLLLLLPALVTDHP